MKLLVVNPNTTASITDLVMRHVRAALSKDIELVAATGRFGARYITDEASYAIAGHAALDCLAVHGAGCDAVLLACFGDPGLFALKEASAAPVLGLAEASMQRAWQQGEKFSIVTGGERWKPMLERLAGALGFGPALASVRPVAPTGGEIAADPDGAIDVLAAACRECAERDGAQAVILGGAGLAGLGVRVQPKVPVPVIDSVLAGAVAIEALARKGHIATARPRYADTVGLTPELARLLTAGA